MLFFCCYVNKSLDYVSQIDQSSINCIIDINKSKKDSKRKKLYSILIIIVFLNKTNTHDCLINIHILRKNCLYSIACTFVFITLSECPYRTKKRKLFTHFNLFLLFC